MTFTYLTIPSAPGKIPVTLVSGPLSSNWVALLHEDKIPTQTLRFSECHFFRGTRDGKNVQIPTFPPTEPNLLTDFVSVTSSGSVQEVLRTRSQSMTGTSLERDEFAGRWCVALPILVQKDKDSSLSLACLPALVVFLRVLDPDRRDKANYELPSYCVSSTNPWLPKA